MRGISWLAENLLACQEGLCSVEEVSIQETLLHATHDTYKYLA